MEESRGGMWGEVGKEGGAVVEGRGTYQGGEGCYPSLPLSAKVALAVCIACSCVPTECTRMR